MVTKLTLEYDGGGFSGWAKQPGLRTVEGVLERALIEILGPEGEGGSPLRLTVAGRTDRGVHAWGQVASYRHETVDLVRLNSLLPADLCVLRCERAVDGFDARRDARSRTYCYSLSTRPARPVFGCAHALWWRAPLDLDALVACSALLIGAHDFTAFTPSDSDHVRFEREVLCATWLQEGEMLEFWITADTFMRHMNRVLVGTMLEVGSGRRPLEDFSRLLTGARRCEAGPTAPAHGLALAGVSYEPRASSAPGRPASNRGCCTSPPGCSSSRPVAPSSSGG